MVRLIGIKIVAVLSVFILNFTQLNAQTNQITIKGAIHDKISGEPIVSAPITIFDSENNLSMGKDVLSDSDGKFELQIEANSYLLKISYMGYEDLEIPISIKIEKRIYDFGKIYLEQNSILLNEAIITGKIAEVRVLNDTLEYNADAYKIQEGGVLEDIIKSMPGAEVSAEGKITINGKPVQKVMINGQEFFSNDPKIASKNLPAKMINKVQVVNRKSNRSQMTGFDDGEEETIINLTIKPEMQQGFLANVYTGYGTDNRHETNVMTNYMNNQQQYTLVGGFNNTNNLGFSDGASAEINGIRLPRKMYHTSISGLTESGNGAFNFTVANNKKFRIGGDVRYGVTDNDTDTNILRENFLNSGNSFTTEDIFANNKSENVNATLRMEWNPDSLTSIIFTPSVQYMSVDKIEQSDFYTTSGNDLEISRGNFQYTADGNTLTLKGDLDASRKLNDRGRILSLSLKNAYDDTDTKGDNYSFTKYTTGAVVDLVDQNYKLDNNNFYWKGLVSYIEPISKQSALQLTYGYEKNKTDALKDTYTLGDLDPEYSGDLSSSLGIHQIGASLQTKKKNYDYTIGLQAEALHSDSRNTGMDSERVKEDLIRISPIIHFNYRWGRQMNFHLDYKGLNKRVTELQLSPSFSIVDAFSSTFGNLSLKPTFEHQVNYRLQRFNPKKKSALMIFGQFSYLQDDIVNDTYIDSENLRITQFQNVDGNFRGNIRVLFTTPLRNKSISLNTMSYVNYDKNSNYFDSQKNRTRSLILQEAIGITYRSDIFDLGFRGKILYNHITQKIDNLQGQNSIDYGINANTAVYFPLDFTFESDIGYLSNSGYANGFRQNEVLWNASISKQFLKKKNLTIRLKAYDILNQRSNFSQTTTNAYVQNIATSTIGRYCMVHCIFRFNSM